MFRGMLKRVQHDADTTTLNVVLNLIQDPCKHVQGDSSVVTLPLNDSLGASFRACYKYSVTQAWNLCKDVIETLKQVQGD